MKKCLAISALLISLAAASAAAPPRAQDPYGQPQSWHGVLSVDDQAQFDRYYAKWIDATRKNDRDDISYDSRKMQEIMTHYNIPVSISFDQVASNPVATAYPAGAYAPAPYPAYPAAAQRLSADDQKEFDKDYGKWVEATRKNNQEDVSEHARKMQDIMARYNIPVGVPFAQVASGGSAGAYPNPAYAYPQPQRLSSDDQKNFDKAYKKWLEARHKNHKEDMDENERKMHDIMARYNIPANVPYEQIATPGIYR
jgi:hypothetical protein